MFQLEKGSATEKRRAAMSELLILYYKHTAVSNAGGKSMARPVKEGEMK
jgi:hypothetical protein